MRLGGNVTPAVIIALLCACANDPKLTERQAAFKAARETREERARITAAAPGSKPLPMADVPIRVGMPKEHVSQIMAARRDAGRPDFLCREPGVGRDRTEAWSRCHGECPCSEDDGLYIFRSGAVAVIIERSFRSSEGFQAARWGMTQAEVAALFPSATSQGPALLEQTTAVAGYPARVQFYFARDRLANVDVTFEPVGLLRSKDEGRAVLRRLLNDKYGAGQSFASGDLWTTKASRIGLRLAQPALKELLISYGSIELEDLLGAASKDALKEL